MTPEQKAELTGDIQRGDDSDHDRLAASGVLTQEEKRIKIAESCGWKKDYPCVDDDYENPTIAWRKPDGSGPWGDSYLPNYFRDLNAMHEAEKSLNEYQWRIYSSHIFHLTFEDGIWAEIRATAAQRAEAFGKTLKLW